MGPSERVSQPDAQAHCPEMVSGSAAWFNRNVTDVRLLTLALAIIVPLSMLIYSNSRITEAKETLRAEMSALRMEIKAGFGKMSSEIKECAAT
jgi:hypothetical protein